MENNRPRSRSMTGAAILIGLGALLLLRNFGLFSWSLWRLWPLLLVAAGVGMVVERNR